MTPFKSKGWWDKSGVYTHTRVPPPSPRSLVYPGDRPVKCGNDCCTLWIHCFAVVQRYSGMSVGNFHVYCVITFHAHLNTRPAKMLPLSACRSTSAISDGIPFCQVSLTRLIQRFHHLMLHGHRICMWNGINYANEKKGNQKLQCSGS